jgi:hypothetical protein
MICPQCRAEYREGFNRCADCEVALVNTLPAEPAQHPEFDGELVTIWAGDDQSQCLALCLALKDAGIRYDVWQDVKSRLGMNVDWRYELSVPEDAAGAARELLGLSETVAQKNSEATDEDGEHDLLEYPDTPPSADDDARIRRSYESYLDPWYPEDATIEIWTQAPGEGSAGVDMSLQTNCIRFREELLDDGSKKYFVMPADEAVAREIVRQIVEESPSP